LYSNLVGIFPGVHLSVGAALGNSVKIITEINRVLKFL